MIAVLAIVLAVIATIGEANEDLVEKCDSNAVALASNFLLNHPKSYSSVECFVELVGCVGFDVQKPLELCAKELNMPKLTDPQFAVELLQSSTNDYYNVLQATCCVKTKEAEVNGLTYKQIDEKVKECAKKHTCQ